MKKMKFRKLSRVLISISLLVIIAVSLISVPVSAADIDTYVGTWQIGVFTEPAGSSFNDYLNTGDAFINIFVYDAFVDAQIVEIRLQLYSSAQLKYFEVKSIYNDTVYWTYIHGDYVEFNNQRYYSGDMFTQLRTLEFTEEPPSSANASLFLGFLNDYATYTPPPVPQPSLLENILGTFSEVGSWIGTIISSLVALFWSVETASLTFLGILSVAGLAFSVIMLLFGIVTRFVGFSG